MDQTDPRVIEETAVRLEGLNYAPTVVLPVADISWLQAADNYSEAYFFHADTTARSKELGLHPAAFYFLGRGGTLGVTP